MIEVVVPFHGADCFIRLATDERRGAMACDCFGGTAGL
jgi:hypothetical protein